MALDYLGKMFRFRQGTSPTESGPQDCFKLSISFSVPLTKARTLSGSKFPWKYHCVSVVVRKSLENSRNFLKVMDSNWSR